MKKTLKKILPYVILFGVIALFQFYPDSWRQFTAMVVGSEVMEYGRPRVVVKLTPGPPQPKVSPAEAGIDMAGIQAAVDYAGARNSRALVIGQGGHIVFEKYWDGTTLETPVDLSGFTPVLSALVLGAAMNDERSINLDAPLGGYIAEWAEDARGAISLRQLLTRSSGFAKPGSWPWPGTRASRYAPGAELRPVLLTWPLDPKLRQGESPAAINADILALALANRLEQPFDKLLADLVWRPIEGGEFSMARGARAGCCIRARLGDWMRIAEVLANNGVFEGNQLTPPHYVSLMLKPTYPESPMGFFVRVGAKGSFAAHDVAWLESAGSQRLWIVPSLRLTILRVGDDPPDSQGWDEAMIPDSIIRNMSSWQQGAGSEGVDLNKYAPH
jgi:CubicO group peptidase (beta-lactamase class C family)